MNSLEVITQEHNNIHSSEQELLGHVADLEWKTEGDTCDSSLAWAFMIVPLKKGPILLSYSTTLSCQQSGRCEWRGCCMLFGYFKNVAEPTLVGFSNVTDQTFTSHFSWIIKQPPVFTAHSLAASVPDVSCQHKIPEEFSFLSNLFLPGSLETQDIFSDGGSFFRGRGWGKDCAWKVGKKQGGSRISVGSVKGSSLMPLSVVQGDHRGDAVAEEELLPLKRASRKSSAVLPSGLRVCG